MYAMIENMVQEFLKQSPSTASVLILVVLFIKYISKRDKAWEMAHKEEVRDHLEAREASRAAILDNTKAMVRLIEKLDGLTAICPIGKIRDDVQITVKKRE